MKHVLRKSLPGSTRRWKRFGLAAEPRSRTADRLTAVRAGILSWGRGLVRRIGTVGLVLAMGTASATSPSTAGVGVSPSARDPVAFAERWVRLRHQQPGSRVVTRAAPLDARLRLTPCSVPLTATPPAVDRVTPRVSVQVHCADDPGWTARITVELHVYRTVLVAARPLSRGDGVAPGDVRGEERDVARLGYGYFDRLDQLHARVLAHPVMQGSVLTPMALGGRQMVRAGDQVQIVANLEGIAVRAGGTALGSGDTGSRIRVRNVASGRVIDALIDSPGVVEALP